MKRWQKFKRVLNLRKSIPLVFRLLRDPRVSTGSKLLYAALAVGYFMLPFDLLFDWIPGIGYLDDIGVVLYLTEKFIEHAPANVVAEYTER